MDKLKIGLQYIAPKHLISRLIGKLAQAELGSFTTKLITWFINQYKIDMSEAANPDPASYKTFNDFFTRPLAEGMRPLHADPSMIVHPVDGAVSQLGPIESGRIFQAKGHHFTAEDLLGGDTQDSDRFLGGEFATIYLAPKDYHRIHMPIKGTLSKMIYVPGDLFSVNPLTARYVPELFARNERVVAIFETDIGPMAMVLVGATVVASIETVWAGTVTPPAGKRVFTWSYPTTGNNTITLEKGAEMGRFKLGSTVVMLFGKDALADFAEGVIPEAVTRMGQPFAHLKNPPAVTQAPDTVEQTEKTDAITITEPVEAIEAVEAVETAAQAEKADTIATVEPAEATETTQAEKAAPVVETVETATKAEKADTITTVEPAEATETTQAEKAAPVVEAVETAAQAEKVDTIATVEPAEAPETAAQATKTAETTTETVAKAETLETVDTATAEADKVEQAESTVTETTDQTIDQTAAKTAPIHSRKKSKSRR